jgi:hypothetical protein
MTENRPKTRQVLRFPSGCFCSRFSSSRDH